MSNRLKKLTLSRNLIDQSEILRKNEMKHILGGGIWVVVICDGYHFVGYCGFDDCDECKEKGPAGIDYSCFVTC